MQKLKLVAQQLIDQTRNSLVIDLKTYHSDHQSSVRTFIESQSEITTNEKEILLNEFLSFGPLTNLLDDPSITEILVNGPDNVWIEKDGQLFRHETSFLTEVTFKNVVDRIVDSCGVEATIAHPFADGTLRNARIHLAAPPASPQITLSIRKRSTTGWDFQKLQRSEWASSGNLQLLENLVRTRNNILIAGGTSSGKTSVLSACLSSIENNQRCILVEDTSELNLPNEVSNSLLSRRDPKGILPEISLQDLVKQSLRMRPDRIIMGEVRGGEAKDLLMAFSTGHDGSMGTIHATNVHEALLRLEMLVQLGAPQWSLSAIRRLIFLALKYVVVVTRTASGKRQLEGIYKVSSLEDFGFLTERVSAH